MLSKVSGLFKFAVLLCIFATLFMFSGPIGLVVGLAGYCAIRAIWRTIAHILAIILGYAGKFCLKLGTAILHTAY